MDNVVSAQEAMVNSAALAINMSKINSSEMRVLMALFRSKNSRTEGYEALFINFTIDLFH